jgi:hypothetical protein
MSGTKKHAKQVKRNKKKKATPNRKNLSDDTTQKEAEKQIGMFSKLPTTCSACSADFPKTQEAHMTWTVVVKSEQEKISLFCPDCMQKTREIINTTNPEGEQSE